MSHESNESHDGGLSHDLNTLAGPFARRRALLWLAGATALPLFACGGGSDDDTSTTTGSSSSGSGSSGSSSSGTCAVIPEETAGPYPGDGSNTNGSGIANALALSGIVRNDIRSSFAGATGVAAGVPLIVNLRLVNTNNSCADLSGYAIYLWHCDREGRYSMYSSGVTAENYLRGVQATDSAGEATFTTIFPGCYSGRMPHIHFEVYRSTSTATSSVNKLRTSQLAFPDAVCDAVYATSGYSASVSNYSRITFATDNVFSDGVTLQVAEVSGSVDTGYIAALTVGIAV
jgi:protocatechuate 3,4-dioxygenase beta subunit